MLAWLIIGSADRLSARAQEGEPPAAPPAGSEYFTQVLLTPVEGVEIVRKTIHGPPRRPEGFEQATTAVLEVIETGTSRILAVPAYDWYYGCSATSAAMIAAYHDRNGYGNLYTGPTNSGVMPLTSSTFGFWTDGDGDTYNQCPLTASRNGLDGRTTRGSIDDYWVSYFSTTQDPFITNDWTEHTYGDAVGDYMRTSQSTFGNVDGSTSFYTYATDPAPISCDTLISWGIEDDGTAGRRDFYEARGYTVTSCYNQNTDNLNTGDGFTFAMYQAEIDAGRPVFLNLTGHSIVGIGYDDATNTIYINDTWDYSTHSMSWGGSYAGMDLDSVSMVTLSSLTMHTLDVSRNGTGSGTVASSPSGISCGSDCSEAYPEGTLVTLTAVVSTGSTFTGWSGACTGTGTCTLTMDAAKSVTATFTLNSYTLSVSRNGTGSGTVTSVPVGIDCGADCSEVYNYSTSVTLTAAASTGSTFTGWSGACTGTGTCTVTMTAARSVTATFTLNTFLLSVSKSGTGSGTVTSVPAGISCGADCSETYNYNTSVTLTAAASTGSTFVGWSGACTGTGSCTVTMTAARSVTATFTLNTFLLNVSKDGTGGGTVTSVPVGISCGADCSETYNYNTSVTLTAAASTGSTFTGWSGACTGTGTCTVTMDAAKAVTATFTLNSYTLAVTKTGTGGGSVTSVPAGIDCGSDCQEAYLYPTSVTLTASPNVGSTFTGWSGACTGTGTCTVTMDAAKSVSAEFTQHWRTWYLAEGYTGEGFGTYILIQNPTTGTADVTITYMLQGGGTIIRSLSVPANARTTVVAQDPDQVGPGQAFSTKLESTRAIIVERAMYWSDGMGGLSGHVTTGFNYPQTTWYLAEGYTGDGFDTFILVQNPSASTAHITVTYMLQGGGTITKSISVASNARYTIRAADADQVGPGLAFSTRLVSDQPIIVERAMYFNNEGHAAGGVSAPATTWYLAEGYTGDGFDTFILVQNPSASTAHITVDYMLQGGGTITKSISVVANARYTIRAADADQVGPGLAFSTRLTSDQAIIVERAMYWSKGDGMAGGHDSTGATSPGTTWYLAEGYTGDGFGTYILIQNPGADEASITLTYMLQGGGVLTRTLTVPGYSRYTVVTQDADQVGTGQAFATKVASDIAIIVERAMYFLNGGHATTGVRQP